MTNHVHGVGKDGVCDGCLEIVHENYSIPLEGKSMEEKRAIVGAMLLGYVREHAETSVMAGFEAIGDMDNLLQGLGAILLKKTLEKGENN